MLGLGDATRDEARIFEVGDANRQVEALFEQRDLPVVEVEIELDVRMLRAEVAHCGREMTVPEAQRSRDAQRAGKLAVLLADDQLRLAQVFEDPSRSLVEGSPCVGEALAPRRSVQQLCAEALLEVAQAAADGGLGDVELVCSGGDAAGIDDADEGFEFEESAHD